MKNSKAKKDYRWSLIFSALICAIITIIARYTFHVESYSSSTILGLASGLGFIAAIWLAYSIIRIK